MEKRHPRRHLCPRHTRPVAQTRAARLKRRTRRRPSSLRPRPPSHHIHPTKPLEGALHLNKGGNQAGHKIQERGTLCWQKGRESSAESREAPGKGDEQAQRKSSPERGLHGVGSNVCKGSTGAVGSPEAAAFWEVILRGDALANGTK